MSHAVTFALLLAISPALQDDPRAATVAPFVTEETAAVLHLDLERLDVEALAGRVLGGVLSDREIEGATAGLAGWVTGLREAGATDLYLLIDPADQPGLPVVVAPLPDGADAKPIARIFRGRGDGPPLVAWPATATIHGAVVAGTEAALDRLRNAGPADRPALAAAFDAARRRPGDPPDRPERRPAADRRGTAADPPRRGRRRADHDRHRRRPLGGRLADRRADADARDRRPGGRRRRGRGPRPPRPGRARPARCDAPNRPREGDTRRPTRPGRAEGRRRSPRAPP